jgi:hypothetical protein
MAPGHDCCKTFVNQVCVNQVLALAAAIHAPAAADLALVILTAYPSLRSIA